MRKPWHKSDTQPSTLAASAVQEAKQALQEVRAQAPEVARTGRTFAEMRRRNHFVEQLTAIFSGGSGG